MKKELRPVHDIVACEICGRTILKGEHTEAYLAPGGARHVVCELCSTRADGAGWIRESAHDDMPARGPRPESRRPLLGRRRRRRETAAQNGAEHEGAERAADANGTSEGRAEGAPDTAAPPRATSPREPPRDPRHIRAVPTTADAKVERALELFNRTDHQRTVAGLTRALGAPLVAAAPDAHAPSTVTLVVAWELSWYRYVVDLGDASEQVVLLNKGDELAELGAEPAAWNVTMDADGRLVPTQEAAG